MSSVAPELCHDSNLYSGLQLFYLMTISSVSTAHMQHEGQGKQKPYCTEKKTSFNQSNVVIGQICARSDLEHSNVETILF